MGERSTLQYGSCDTRRRAMNKRFPQCFVMFWQSLIYSLTRIANGKLNSGVFSIEALLWFDVFYVEETGVDDNSGAPNVCPITAPEYFGDFHTKRFSETSAGPLSKEVHVLGKSSLVAVVDDSVNFRDFVVEDGFVVVWGAMFSLTLASVICRFTLRFMDW